MNARTVACFGNPVAGRRRRGLAWTLSALLLAGPGIALPQGGSAPKFGEYEVKAAFLFNFMHFVHWPDSAMTNAGAPLLIGVLGEDPFGSILEKTIKDETVHGRSLAIRRKRQIVDLKGCHLVFVCRSESAQLGNILGALHGFSTLTVSDIDQFCRDGGMIGLVSEGGRIRLEINQAAAEQSKLKISSQLLRLARLKGK